MGRDLLAQRAAAAAVPVARVGEVAFDAMHHGMDPRRGGVVLILLDDEVGLLPVAAQSMVDGGSQLFLRRRLVAIVHFLREPCESPRYPIAAGLSTESPSGRRSRPGPRRPGPRRLDASAPRRVASSAVRGPHPWSDEALVMTRPREAYAELQARPEPTTLLGALARGPLRMSLAIGAAVAFLNGGHLGPARVLPAA